MQSGFDLRRVDTYYTRPMSEPWSKPRDVGALADEQAVLELAIPLAEFSRVRERLGALDGTVNGRVRFGRDGEYVVAALEISGSVPLICQRCLKLMPWKIDGQALVALLGADAQADRVPEHLEPMLAEGGRISLRDLLEEELLLELPIVALHSDERACKPAVAVDEDRAVQRPFERLGELLKRATEPSIAREETDHGRTKKS
jgi:uncharacterized protein